MFHNNVLISGSEVVYMKFIDIIQKYIKNRQNNFVLARRTHRQYLGETDKGSILVIKKPRQASSCRQGMWS